MISGLLLSPLSYNKDPKISTLGTVGKRKHTTLMIPQKLEIIRRFENGESCSMVMTSYNIILSTVYDI
jgi:hypothetical protein